MSCDPSSSSFSWFCSSCRRSRGSGKIRGKVVDKESKEALVGANVSIEGTTYGAATNVDGEYLIFNVPVGTYTLKATFVGYGTVTISNTRVNNDLTTTTDFTMSSEAVALQGVEIVAERPLVNRNATNAVRITTSEDIANLPVRGINNVLALSPGVVLQDNVVFVRGGRQDEVGFYLEGVSITNPMVGGRAVTLVQDAVEEIQVQAGGYNAEFGGANSGIIQQQLRSGTSAWKFSLNYTTDNLTFKPRDDVFNGEKTLGAYQFGYNEATGTLSGPLFDERFKFFMQSTDNGPHMNSWPDGAMTPFRNEKNSNWEGAYRVPAMVRWPGKIKPGSVSNEMVAHHDWLPTFVAMAGDTQMKEKLLKGYKAGDMTYKVHLDGDNLVPYLTGQAQKSPRESFLYINDDQQVTGIRYDNWKIVFMEQRAQGTLRIWGGAVRQPAGSEIFNLRTDPYERADITSNTYYDWLLDHAFQLVPAQAYVGQFLMTFKDYPQRQKAASFNLDEVMQKLKEGGGGSRVCIGRITAAPARCKPAGAAYSLMTKETPAMNKPQDRKNRPAAADGKKTFTLLHTNDMHSSFIGMGPAADYTPFKLNDYTTRGGYARLAAPSHSEGKNARDRVLC